MTTPLAAHAALPVVVDVNVYLHAFDKTCRQHISAHRALDEMFTNPRYKIQTSEHILDNIYWKAIDELGYRADIAAGFTETIEDAISKESQIYSPDTNMTDFIKDREDDNILALAAVSNASFVVSNDRKDLTALGSWRNIPIIDTDNFNSRTRGSKMKTVGNHITPMQELHNLVSQNKSTPTQPTQPTFER